MKIAALEATISLDTSGFDGGVSNAKAQFKVLKSELDDVVEKSKETEEKIESDWSALGTTCLLYTSPSPRD